MNQSQIKILTDMGAEKLSEIAENTESYAHFLKFQGRIYKQPATVAIEFYAQRPKVQFIATAKQWASAGYNIIDGGEAIHFTDESGIKEDLFDFSQINSNIASWLWTINADNIGEFRTALGISDGAPIIKSLIEQTVNKSAVIDCMERLGVPPNEFEQFNVTYYNAIQTIVAGRFEIGGNQFDISPNSTAFQELDDVKKIHFLTLVSETARGALQKIEKIANEIAVKTIQNNQERGETHETNVSTVGKSHGGTVKQRSGGQTTGSPESGFGGLLSSKMVIKDNQRFWQIQLPTEQGEVATKLYSEYKLKKVSGKEVWYKFNPMWGYYSMNLTGAEPSITEAPIGDYGTQWISYMKEHHPHLVGEMRMKRNFLTVAMSVDERAWEYRELLDSQYAKAHPRPTQYEEVVAWERTRTFHTDGQVMREKVLIPQTQP